MKNLYKSLLLNTLSKAQRGCLELKLPDGEIRIFGSPDTSKSAHWQIHDESLFRDIVLKNDIGLGEGYESMKWDTDDLTDLIRWLLINQPFFKGASNPFFAKLGQSALLLIERLGHFRNRNSVGQSSENISYHYDLGNAFYHSFLDPTMTYSSAFFTDADQDLQSAQNEKYDRICRKINLKPHHHLLEIGTGWGGFAIYAAQNYGCKVTTTTISKEQFEYAVKRVVEHDLVERVEVLFQDYRNLRGSYDRIVSIEMLEAVGHQFLGEYFSQCGSLLVSDGLAAFQVITCPNSQYRAYTRKVDWIRKHIFPGGHLPSVDSITQSITGNGVKWDLYHMESFGLHYAKTLNCWRDRFQTSLAESQLDGLSDSFARKWNFYLSYCEAGFLERHVNVVQLVFGRPDISAYNFECASPRKVTVKQSVQVAS